MDSAEVFYGSGEDLLSVKKAELGFFANHSLIKELDLGTVKARLFEKDGKEFVDIRQFYKEKPTKKGVVIPIILYQLLKEKFYFF